MVEEPTSTEESGESTAVAIAEGAGEAGSSGRKPIPIALDLLTPEAKKEAEEQSGKPIKDIPYALQSQEKLPESTISLKFEVGAGDFRQELDRFYENMRKEVVIPGFRKGKAPVKLIRIRMGDEADRDAMAETALNVLRQEIAKQDLKLVAEPQIVDWKIEDAQPLQFEVHAELLPKIELKEYKGLQVQVDTHEVTEKGIDAEVERLRADYATWESAPEGHKLAEGDAVVLDIKVEGDKGQELKHMARENSMVNNFKSQLPEPLAQALEGHAVGETVTAGVKTTKPTRRGEELEITDTYSATIKDIKVRKFPALDDEFAKDLGEHETLQALRDSLRKNLTEAEDNRERGMAITRLTQSIFEKNPFDVPHSMIAASRYRSIMEDNYQLQRLGLRLEQVVTDPEQYLSNQRGAAEFRVKQAYLFGELAKIENLEVTEEEIEKEIAQIAERSGRKPLAVRARLEAEKKLDTFKMELLNRKLVDFLIANNTINKVPHVHDHEHGHEGHAHGEEGEAKS